MSNTSPAAAPSEPPRAKPTRSSEAHADPALPPPRPHEVKRRRLCITNSLPVWPASPQGGTPSESGASPALIPRSPADVESTDWWSPDQLSLESPRRFALEQLRRYILDFRQTDRDDFWQRKSGKAVLSVVICKSQDGDDSWAVHRGMNTEVSLPAGSLCAERAAIGRAASSFQRASDILVVATADPEDKINPLWPCEVCQSWFAKLRAVNPNISVLAIETAACERFVVRVNGETQPPPMAPLPPSIATCRWRDRVVLAEGICEMPWDAQETVYIDGAWAFMHSAHQHILRVARMRGSHLLVGIHSDEVLEKECRRPPLESFGERLERVLHNRYVSSVLKDAPWMLTQEMLFSLGIKRVITGSVDKLRDVGRQDRGPDPYGVARDRNILEVVPSLDGTTESSHQEARAARASNARLPQQGEVPAENFNEP